MAKADVYYYAEGGQSPPLRWLLKQPAKVQGKFDVLIELLEEKSNTLSRPYAAPLRNKIYELRVRHMNVNYRLLYFFARAGVVILAHGCTKEQEVDDADIERAVRYRVRYLSNPNAHTFVIEEDG